MALHQRSQRGGAQQRDVTREQYQRSSRALQVRLDLQERVARSELRLLQCKAKTHPFRETGLHGARHVAHDNCNRGGLERLGRAQNMDDQRLARCGMQDLRQVGFHPRALARGQNGDVNTRHVGMRTEEL